MKQIFTQNLDFIFLFYGAAFIFLGTACLVLYFREKTRRILPWIWLSAFGFLHGINEWLDMLAISFLNPKFFWSFRAVFLTVSYVCLVEFGRRAIFVLQKKKAPSVFVYFVLSFPIIIFLLFNNTPSDFVVLVRYFYGFIGAAWTAYIFWIFKFSAEGDIKPHFYKWLSFVFLLYAITAGLIVPKANVLLASFLNDKSFFDLFSIPIQFFRAILASLIALFFVYKATKITLYVYGKGRSVLYLKTILVVFVIVYIISLFGGLKLVSWVEMHEKDYKHRMILSDAKLIAQGLSASDLASLLQVQGKLDYSQYRQMHKKMSDIVDISPFIRSIYLISWKEGRPNFLVGSQEQVFLKDSPLVFDNISFKFISDAFYSSRPTLTGPYQGNDLGEEFFSVFVPILNNESQVIGVLGLDAIGFEVRLYVMRFRLFALLVLLIFLVLLIASYAFLITFALKSLELEVQKNNLDKALVHIKEAESELAKSEETFRGILSNSPNAIFGFDRELRVIYWNHGAEKLYGYHKNGVVNEKNPLLSKKITDVFGSDSQAGSMERIFSGETIKMEVRHELRDKKIDVIMTLFPVKDPAGHILFGLGLVQDISDHKKLEMRLMEERDRLRVIATSIGAGLSLIDKTHSIVWVNETIENWFGKLNSIKGKRCFEAYQYRQTICSDCPAEKTFKTGKMQIGEQRSIFPDGRVMDFLLICTPIKNELGEVAQVLELTLDMTERRKIFELLEYERALSKNVINSISDNLLVLDCKDRSIIDVNKKFLDDHKLARSEVLGKKCADVGDHLCPPCEACGFEDVVKNGKIISETHVHMVAGGKQIYVDVTMAPLKNERSETIGVIHISRDITERKYLEDELKRYSEHLENLVKLRTVALQKSELMFRRLFETAQDGILIIDAAMGDIIDVNPYLLNLLECSRDSMQNVHFSKVGHMLDSSIFNKMFEDLKSRLSVVYPDVEVHSCSSRPLFVEFYASVYYVEDKKIIQCNVRDITERKKMEKVKSEFVSMVSHELRTPLSAIKEGVEIVADGTQGKLNKSQSECLNIALSNIKRLNRLIGDILDISKIQSNLLKVQSMDCSVYDILNYVSSVVKVEIEKKGLTLKHNIEDGLPAIYADRDRLIQILMNLLNNAVKFTRESSCITLSCRRVGDFVEFSVSDEGEGIPQEALSRLFGKFVQLDSTLVRRVGGTGLGLYISKNLVDAMGGQIWAESELGRGSIFKFTIPIQKDKK